ncbi:hypothetical protein [Sinomonas atrocyanea]
MDPALKAAMWVVATPVVLFVAIILIAIGVGWVLAFPVVAIGGGLLLGASLKHLEGARRHVREIHQVQVKLRKDAKVKRVQELKFPTYIRRWYPERRMRHMRALHQFDVLLEAMEDEARLRSGLPGRASSTAATPLVGRDPATGRFVKIY